MADKKKKKMSTEKMHGMTYNMVTQALWILFIVVFILLLVYGARQAYKFGYALFDKSERNVTSTEVTISILEDSSTMTVAKQLERAGLIDSAYVFWVQSKLFDCELKPGVYTFNRRISSRNLLELFNKGPETTDESGQ